MQRPRGRSHTTLTETAATVVHVLKSIPGVTMIAPGEIRTRKGSGKRYVTAVFTTAGMELLISGQSVQKVAVHCPAPLAPHIYQTLQSHKKLADTTFKTRVRKPGI